MKACVIVDENVQDLVWGGGANDRCDYRDLHRGLAYGTGPCRMAVLAVCDQLLKRYSNAMLDWLEEVDRLGRSEPVDGRRVANETEWVVASNLCRSTDDEDRMLLGLARASGARILATNDDQLTDDFRNRAIIDPPGAVYRKPAHNAALQKCCRQAGRTAARRRSVRAIIRHASP
jgi:hypothetical protein